MIYTIPAMTNQIAVFHLAIVYIYMSYTTLPTGECFSWKMCFHYSSGSNPAKEIGFLEVFVNLIYRKPDLKFLPNNNNNGIVCTWYALLHGAFFTPGGGGGVLLAVLNYLPQLR